MRGSVKVVVLTAGWRPSREDRGENGRVILVDRVVAPYFATNCWILSPSKQGECIIIDPGIAEPNLVKAIRDRVAANGLKIVAILITHGHLDHTFSLVPLQEDVGTSKVLVHRADRDLLSKPELAMGPQGIALFRELSLKFGGSISEPEGIEEIHKDATIKIAGLSLRILNTPGHTPGSIVAVVNDEILVSGDTLFAGSIGRTDLPRGSISDMQISLREKIATLPGHLEVLPGHGDRTRLEREMTSNPYLIGALEGRLS